MAKKKKKQPIPVPDWIKYAWWIIPLVGILVYIPSFNADFTLDDVIIIEDNTLIKSAEKLPGIWTSHYWAGKIDASDTGLYRPLTLTSYAIQYLMSGDNPIPFHIFNILLHALTVFVMMRFINLLFKDFRLTLLAGLLFAIHPLHTEAVSGIVGRAEILAGLFILIAGICYHQYRYHASIKWLMGLLFSTGAAITSKEHGFMLPAILILQEVVYYFNAKQYHWGEKRKWLALVTVILISIGLWIVRSTITGPTVPHEQWLGVDSSARMATAFRTNAEYILLHVWPLRLSADYWTSDVPIVGWGQLSVLMSLLMMLFILGLAVWQRRLIKSFSWGVLFFFLTLAPVSNILFAAGFLKAERILYIPSIGLIVAIAALMIKLLDSKRGKIPSLILIGAFSLFFLARTWIRAGDWHNNYTLAEATLKTSPESPRFNNMMGLELRALKRNEEAMLYFEKSVHSNPNHVPALVNLGTEYKHFNKLPEAAATLERALEIDPSTYATYVNLMSVYRSMENYDKNVLVAERALKRFPESPAVLWNAANAYQLKNEMAKANELRAKAREIDPDIGQ